LLAVARESATPALVFAYIIDSEGNRVGLHATA
jgi:predicted enzyme related to lactoylglutathione lyase